jgi:hypothetical protein
MDEPLPLDHVVLGLPQIPVLRAEQGGQAEQVPVVRLEDIGGVDQGGRDGRGMQNGADFRAFQGLRPELGQLVDREANIMFSIHGGSPGFHKGNRAP